MLVSALSSRDTQSIKYCVMTLIRSRVPKVLSFLAVPLSHESRDDNSICLVKTYGGCISNSCDPLLRPLYQISVKTRMITQLSGQL